MKLPKNFGGAGFGNMLKQAQDAMARAEALNEELAAERIPVDKGPVKMVFTGLGELVKLQIDPQIVDPEDVESLEDLIVSAVRQGFQHATEIRDARTQQILPNIPGL